jgi:hypothetical protein
LNHLRKILVWSVVIPAALLWLVSILCMFVLLMFGLALREVGGWIASAGYMLKDGGEYFGELLDRKIQTTTGGPENDK